MGGLFTRWSEANEPRCGGVGAAGGCAWSGGDRAEQHRCGWDEGWIRHCHHPAHQRNGQCAGGGERRGRQPRTHGRGAAGRQSRRGAGSEHFSFRGVHCWGGETIFSQKEYSSPIMNELLQSRWFPIALLTTSNVFMTFAWYGHLKYKSSPLWLVILASWGIAFFEYVLAVPANRWGSAIYSIAQLKIMQE